MGGSAGRSVDLNCARYSVIQGIKCFENQTMIYLIKPKFNSELEGHII